MKRYLLSFVLVVMFGTAALAQEKMKKIFDGKSLKGWVVSQGENEWSASKGVLFVQNNADKKGSILWTERHFTNFLLQAEFLMGDGTVDSGFFLRGEMDQVQIGISGSLKRDMTASPYVPKKGYPVEAKGVKDLLKLKDWNTMKIRVVDKTYTVWLNGVEVMTYTSETIPGRGPIGIQLHPNNEMSISYRNIRLAEL
jgi:hypothetical protein